MKKSSLPHILSIGAIFFGIVLLISGCERQEYNSAQGYIEGKYTYVAANANGILKNLSVDRGDPVKQDQKLFTLDLEPEHSQLVQAQEQLNQAIAQIAQVQADLTLSQIILKRDNRLYATKSIALEELNVAQANNDRNEARLRDALANKAAAEAAVTKAQWSQAQKIVTAPAAGFVFDTYFLVGELVSLGTPVLSLLTPENIKVIFFVPAPALGLLKINQPVTISCDQCARKYIAKISFISPVAEYTPPVIYSTETRAKLIFRIEAHIDPKDIWDLHPGQPVSVKF